MGEFENHGVIQLTRTSTANGGGIDHGGGYVAQSAFNNFGTLNIDSMSNEGIAVFSPGGTFTNHPGGHICITNCLQSFSSGIRLIFGRIQNDGFIEIKTSAGHGIWLEKDCLFNSDTIMIRDATTGLLAQSDSLIQDISGYIGIKSSLIPLQIDSNTVFDCQGVLEIRN